MRQMKTIHDINHVVESEALVLLLIKNNQCGVCESLEAKLSLMLESIPAVTGIYVYIEDAPDAASAFLALAAPTILLFAERKEVYRAGRFVRLDELEHVLLQYVVMLEEPGE